MSGRGRKVLLALSIAALVGCEGEPVKTSAPPVGAAVVQIARVVERDRLEEHAVPARRSRGLPARVQHRGAPWDARYDGPEPPLPGDYVIRAIEGATLVLGR